MKTFFACSLCLLVLALPGNAATVDFASLPDWQRTGNYRVDPYMTAASQLQAMGREAACRALLREGRQARRDVRDGDRRAASVVVLCRMLFVPHRREEFRRARLGAPQLLGDTTGTDWPLEPVALVDGIPFLICRGNMLGGVPEAGDDYVRYCLAHCDWNPVVYRHASDQQKRAAVAKLLASPRWKRPLRSDERDFLSSQIAYFPAPQGSNEGPYPDWVPGKPGFVHSLYAPASGDVDVRGHAPGTEMKDPYTGKIFLVPELPTPSPTSRPAAGAERVH